MLAGWGVTMNNDLALDTSGIGQIFGLGPEIAMVTTYESHPIVRDFKEGVPTAIPLSRTHHHRRESQSYGRKLTCHRR